MTPRQLFDLLLLAALWGGSFLFMRVAAPAFGPVPLVFLRVAIGGAVLLPMLGRDGAKALFSERAGPLILTGVLNMALPFCLFAYAALSVTAGFSGLFNATAPLFTALIGWLWFSERIAPRQLAGLFFALAGITVLVWGKASFKSGGSGLAVLAMLGATISYGFTANYARKRLDGFSAVKIAAAAQGAAALLLAPAAFLLWPNAPVPLTAWVCAILLGALSTALANILYFRLIAEAGPSKAVAVTLLIPLFASFWGFLFLGEAITPRMAAGGAIILLGTATALGFLVPRQAKALS